MMKSNFQLRLLSELILLFWLATLFPMKAHNYEHISQMRISQNLQSTSINLNLNDLQKPNILRIVKLDNLQKGDFQGEVILGGKKIRAINSNMTEVDLSALLKPGINILEITAVYTPINSSIKVDFVGTNSSISQESGGSGELNQRFIIKIN